MGLTLLTERRANQTAGVLSCYDRVIVQGTLPVFCYADGMTRYLSARGIRIFDFTRFAQPLTDAIKANAEVLAAANGLKIDYVRKKNFRKEDKVKRLCKSAEPTRDWYGSSRRWSRALPTSHGTTRTVAGPICGTTTANACTTISTSSTKIWGCATYGYPLGVPFVCSSTATGTTGWRGNWTAKGCLHAAGQCPHRPGRWDGGPELGGQLESVVFAWQAG